MPTRSRAPLRLGLAAALVALVFGLAVPTVLAATRGVAIQDFAFSPRTVEIRVGDTVRWTNRDSVAHSATAQNGSFDTGLLSDGESGSVRFTAAGTYRYICTPHPDMTGTVVVRSAGTGIVPPNTATEKFGGDADDGTWFGITLALALLGIVMIVGTVVADRRFRARG